MIGRQFLHPPSSIPAETPVAVPVVVPVAVPVDPEAPEAQQWLRDELAKTEYQSAKPTWFDRLADGIREWFESLQFDAGDGPPALGMLIVVVLVVLVVVVALLMFGLPRFNRRSRVTGLLFGEDDDRTAADMRIAAERAAAGGDHSRAIAETFRSIARGLAERTILTVTPGTTARSFATRAAEVFPAFGAELVAASGAFDAVRYLGRDGTVEQYEQVAALERSLRSTRPALEEVTA